jgi:hypothetical protein
VAEGKDGIRIKVWFGPGGRTTHARAEVRDERGGAFTVECTLVPYPDTRPTWTDPDGGAARRAELARRAETVLRDEVAYRKRIGFLPGMVYVVEALADPPGGQEQGPPDPATGR